MALHYHGNCCLRSIKVGAATYRHALEAVRLVTLELGHALLDDLGADDGSNLHHLPQPSHDVGVNTSPLLSASPPAAASGSSAGTAAAQASTAPRPSLRLPWAATAAASLSLGSPRLAALRPREGAAAIAALTFEEACVISALLCAARLSRLEQAVAANSPLRAIQSRGIADRFGPARPATLTVHYDQSETGILLITFVDWLKCGNDSLIGESSASNRGLPSVRTRW